MNHPQHSLTSTWYSFWVFTPCTPCTLTCAHAQTRASSRIRKMIKYFCKSDIIYSRADQKKAPGRRDQKQRPSHAASGAAASAKILRKMQEKKIPCEHVYICGIYICIYVYVMYICIHVYICGTCGPLCSPTWQTEAWLSWIFFSFRSPQSPKPQPTTCLHPWTPARRNHRTRGRSAWSPPSRRHAPVLWRPAATRAVWKKTSKYHHHEISIFFTEMNDEHWNDSIQEEPEDYYGNKKASD